MQRGGTLSSSIAIYQVACSNVGRPQARDDIFIPGESAFSMYQAVKDTGNRDSVRGGRQRRGAPEDKGRWILFLVNSV